MIATDEVGNDGSWAGVMGGGLLDVSWFWSETEETKTHKTILEICCAIVRGHQKNTDKHTSQCNLFFCIIFLFFVFYVLETEQKKNKDKK